MNFKYYDVLSRLVVGYLFLVVVMYSLQIEYNNDYTVAYLAVAFLCGYVINAIGSLLEPIYYFTIGGKPSNRLLADKYTNMSRGWKVDGKTRYCLTTRNDGNITVVFGESDDLNYSGVLAMSTAK